MLENERKKRKLGLVKVITVIQKDNRRIKGMNWYQIISGTMIENKANNYEGRRCEQSEQSVCVRQKRVGTRETIDEKEEHRRRGI